LKFIDKIFKISKFLKIINDKDIFLGNKTNYKTNDKTTKFKNHFDNISLINQQAVYFSIKYKFSNFTNNRINRCSNIKKRFQNIKHSWELSNICTIQI